MIKESLYRWNFLIVNHHSAKFCDHRKSGSEDKMFSVV